MTSNLLGTDVEGVLAEALSGDDGPLTVVNPTADVVEAVVDVLDAEADRAGPTVRLLADRRLLRDVMDDFLVAGRAADLVAADRLELATAEALPSTSVVVGPDRVVALVTLADTFAGVVTDAPEYVADAAAAADTAWTDASAFTLRTPALGRVRETLAEAVGPEVEADFKAVLASMDTARGDGQGLDEVTVSLLVAARNRELLYDISRWGEDTGVASKATFSRTKTHLEERGLIDTEKVPIDVGRPRLRLKLADERLEDADPAELASVAQSVLAS